MLGYLALTLLPIAAALYLIWAHRKREAERAAASRKRFAEMFGAAVGEKSAPQTVAKVSSASPPVAAPRSASAIPVATALCEKKESLLDARHATLHRAVAQALSGFQVFPHVSLAALVQLPAALQGREREQRLRALAQQTLDCVVCGERMEIVAVIDLEDGTSADSRIKSDYLAAAGVPYLRLDPGALPGADDIRKRVLARAERSPA